MFTDGYPPEKHLAACLDWAGLGAQVLGGGSGPPMHIAALKHGLPKTLPA